MEKTLVEGHDLPKDIRIWAIPDEAREFKD